MSTPTLLAVGYGAVFAVPSSSADRTYTVAFVAPFDGGDGVATCTCPAGVHGKACRHAKAVRKLLSESSLEEFRARALLASLGAVRQGRKTG